MPLTFKESQEAMEMVFKFLDSIDILPYIEEFKGQKLSDMMDKRIKPSDWLWKASNRVLRSCKAEGGGLPRLTPIKLPVLRSG